MAPSPKRPVLQLAVVAVLAAVLALLAVLQYKWSQEVSRAERSRIEANLNASVSQFRQEFTRQLAQLCTAFHREPGPEPDNFWEPYAGRYQAWERSAPHPELLANVYIVQAQRRGRPGLMVLRRERNQFDQTVWPANLAPMRPHLEGVLRAQAGPPGPDSLPFGWTLDERIPALVHAVLDMPRQWVIQHRPAAPEPRILGFVILELSAQSLEQHLFAELAQRYFAGPDGFIYNVAVAGRDKMVYRSDPRITMASLDPPDSRTDLLGPPGRMVSHFEARITRGPLKPPDEGSLSPGNPGPEQRPGRGEAGFRVWGYQTRDRGGLVVRTRGPVIVPAPGTEPWQLLVRHRGGSLESVVAADRRRNLIVSFGVLALLAVSMAMIIISSQRARRLANLQMEFVAGVSHELRTPVAVICSAADNLAEGFVGAREQVKEYGALIRSEGRRLAGMIEQILYFAAGQAGRTHFELRPVSVAEVIESALDGVAALPEAGGLTPELLVDPDLPPVQADSAALARCLQNLIVNAWKYGGEDRWVRLKAERADSGATPRVRVTVEDRGPGIDSADLPHIFEPFYRGKSVRAAQIHGAGLGLSLAREIAEAMGGRLTVESEPGRGSVFTLDLPARTNAPEALPRTA